MNEIPNDILLKIVEITAESRPMRCYIENGVLKRYTDEEYAAVLDKFNSEKVK